MIRLSDPRKALHDALIIYWRNGNDRLLKMANSTNTSFRDVEAVLAAKVMASVKKADDLAQCWAMYAYSPEQQRNDFERVHQAVYDHVTKGEPVHGYKGASRYLHLTAAAIEDMQMRVLTARARITDAEVCRRIRVNHGHFTRDKWKDRFESCLDFLNGIDQRAIEPVAAVCEKLREDKAA